MTTRAAADKYFRSSGSRLSSEANSRVYLCILGNFEVVY